MRSVSWPSEGVPNLDREQRRLRTGSVPQGAAALAGLPLLQGWGRLSSGHLGEMT